MERLKAENREEEERGRLQEWAVAVKEVSSGAYPRDAKPRTWGWREWDPGRKDGHFAEEHRWIEALKNKASGHHPISFASPMLSQTGPPT